MYRRSLEFVSAPLQRREPEPKGLQLEDSCHATAALSQDNYDV
jgi:hypothetical protein